jgi:tRNA(fMet)-specific endonuclease VapC
MKILDSDHCIALLRGKLDLNDHVSVDEELAVTVINVGELIHGASRSAHPAENLARVDVLLATVAILAFDEGSARRFGAIKADLERQGQPLSDLDLQIAAIVLQHSVPLVTHNTRHFARIPDLILEDWLQ